jgi:predicted RNase H-like HicB family nuclease
MKYKTGLHESDEGYCVSVPGVPGCWPQGKTEAEALDNIKDAIREYLAVVDERLVHQHGGATSVVDTGWNEASRSGGRFIGPMPELIHQRVLPR